MLKVNESVFVLGFFFFLQSSRPLSASLSRIITEAAEKRITAVQVRPPASECGQHRVPRAWHQRRCGRGTRRLAGGSWPRPLTQPTW